MLKHKIPLVPAELIGYHMGLVVPENALKFFWNARTGSRPSSGYGTQANRPSYTPNNVFKKLNIPLKMKWMLINKFNNLSEYKSYLVEAVTRDHDVLICYDWPSLFDKENKEHWGHVCVLDTVDMLTDTMRFIDPDQNEPKWKSVKISEMYEAMKVHGKENSGGFWELSVLK